MRASWQSHRRLSRFRPHLEALEDRCVPTVYAITDLGVNVTPVALNNNGVVAAETNGTAVLIQNGTQTTLTGFTTVTGLNDSNEAIVANSSGAALWNNGTVTPIPFGVSVYTPAAIADNGTIAGGYDPAKVDVNGTVTALPDSNTFLTEANTISDNGQYVGGFDNDGNVEGEGGPALWNLATGQVTVLNVDGLGQTNGVNNSGEAVGQYGEDSGGSAFLYSNGQFMDLGLGNYSSANAINDEGVIVGLGAGGNSVFVYSNGVATNLQQLVPAGSGFTLTNALAINDSGQILATATNSAGNEVGVLLNPVPSVSMTVSGFPSTTTAGVAHNVTVTVLNPNGTIDTGYSGTVHFTSSDPQAGLPANYTFVPSSDAGVHTFSVTLKTAGTQSFTVSDTTTSTLFASQQGITVNPGAATHFALEVTTNTVNSGQSFYILVQALDAYGNIATGYTGTVHFSNSVSGNTLPGNFTFHAGVGQVYFLLNLTKKGKQAITITDTANSAIFGSVAMDVT